MRRLLHHFNRLFKGVTVTALVGKPGTGKSFRAKLVAEKYGIDIIVDDGLVIKDNKILAGTSAKNETKYLTAIKTAIFNDAERAEAARHALQRENVEGVLILGTSDRMVHRIAHRLKLPAPSLIVNINDVATQEEIAAARQSRLEEGKHIIPVPAIEVKREHEHIFMDSIRIFLQQKFFRSKQPQQIVEKSVVRPVYADRGSVRISEEALIQMVVHCAQNHNPDIRVTKVVLGNAEQQYELEVILSLPIGTAVSPEYHALQQSVLQHIERYAGISVKEVHITFGKFYTRKTQNPESA